MGVLGVPSEPEVAVAQVAECLVHGLQDVQLLLQGLGLPCHARGDQLALQVL